MNHRSKIGHLELGLDRVRYLLTILNTAPRVLSHHTPTGRIASPNYNHAGGRGTDTTSTTERHALNPDPEQQLVDQVFTTFRTALHTLELCAQAITALNATATPKPLREPTLPPPCECCGETSLRIEGGLCAERCAPSWRRHRAATRHPDRTRWLTDRRKRLTSTPTT